MMEQRSELSTAVSLMRMALALLDKAGETSVAVHLQQAIDIAIEAPVPQTIEEAEAMLQTPEACRLLDRVDPAK